MTKRFTLPDSHTFSIKALPGVDLTVNFAAMSNEDFLNGVVRGIKNILGDAVGGSEKSYDEKLRLAQEKLDSYVAGTIGDGKTLSPFEVEMRKNLSAWLQARKWKQSAADKYAREGDGVFAQFKSLCEKNSIDWTAGKKVYDSWSDIAVDILKRRAEAASLVATIEPPADESAATDAA